MTMAARTIPTILIKNMAKAPETMCKSNLAIPIPMVARGGTKATAMAVPGKVSFKSGLTRAKAVEAPAITAMNR